LGKLQAFDEPLALVVMLKAFWSVVAKLWRNMPVLILTTAEPKVGFDITP
jgi:hypothetical protein